MMLWTPPPPRRRIAMLQYRQLDTSHRVGLHGLHPKFDCQVLIQIQDGYPDGRSHFRRGEIS